MFSKSNLSKFLKTAGVVGLVIYGFFVAQVIIALILGAFVHAGIMTSTSLQSAVVQFNASLAAYILALVIILGIFTAIRNSTKGLTKIVAIAQRPTLNLLFYVVIGYGVYFCSVSCFYSWRKASYLDLVQIKSKMLDLTS